MQETIHPAGVVLKDHKRQQVALPIALHWQIEECTGTSQRAGFGRAKGTRPEHRKS